MMFSWLKETTGSYIHPDLYMKVHFAWLHEVSGVMW
jgi:hypothetical protein